MDRKNNNLPAVANFKLPAREKESEGDGIITIKSFQDSHGEFGRKTGEKKEKRSGHKYRVPRGRFIFFLFSVLI